MCKGSSSAKKNVTALIDLLHFTLAEGERRKKKKMGGEGGGEGVEEPAPEETSRDDILLRK